MSNILSYTCGQFLMDQYNDAEVLMRLIGAKMKHLPYLTDRYRA